MTEALASASRTVVEAPGLRLAIAVPALDEEESIAMVIARCLEARAHITANSPVDEVNITVVSDGSTDRTVERASPYADQVRIVVFPENRGYGAAILEAWRHSDTELVGFLDADGTCDPMAFADLCRALVSHDADMVIGSRLGKDGRMPLVRRIGNLLFAWILTLFSARRVRDVTSGMRVLRRTILPRLMPLPDGLHFTPAMSARAVLGGGMKVIEVDIPYAERQGESKLAVVRDGLRFVKVIVREAFRYRPLRLFGLAGWCSFAVAATLMVPPILYYLEHRSVAEWMIYRFVVSDLAGTLAVLLFMLGYLADRVVRMTLSGTSGERPLFDRVFESKLFPLAPLGLCGVGGLLVVPSLIDLITTGGVYEHWSRFIVMAFCVSTAFILVVGRLVVFNLYLVAERMEYLAGGRTTKASSSARAESKAAASR